MAGEGKDAASAAGSAEKGGWFYLDRSGAEYGPFEDEQMKAWFTSGLFMVGKALLVRKAAWSKHKPISDLWPDEKQPFAAAPRDPGDDVVGDDKGLGPVAKSHPPPASYPPLPAYPGHPPPHGAAPPAMPAYGYAPPPAPFYGPPPVGWMPPPVYPHYGHMPLAAHPYGYQAPRRGSSPSRSRSRSPARNRGGRRQNSRTRGRDRGDRDRDRERDRDKPFKPHHASVPKETDLHQKFGTPEGSAPTTAMLRNIPNRYMQESLLEEIHDEGFENSYDFFYLPIDVRNNANVGYAFINFIHPKDLDRFMSHFEGYSFKRPGSKKVAAVSAATVQGLKQNLENLVRRRVAKGQHRPIVVRNGQRIDLEQAEREILRS